MIDNEKVRVGRLIRVKNKDPKPNASRWYYSTWVENADKSNLRQIFLTENELKRAEERAGKNPEDQTRRSLWVRVVEFLRG